jgi:HEAT repeat protein
MADLYPTSETDEILRALEETRYDPPPVEDLIRTINDREQSLDAVNNACNLLQWEGRWRDPTAIEALVALLANDALPIERRVLAIWPLCNANEKQAIGPLSKILADKNLPLEYRSRAIQALVELTEKFEDREAVPFLIQVLEDRTIGRKLQGTVARALGSLHDSRALRPLLELLANCHHKERAACISALGELGDPGAIPALTALLLDPAARKSHRGGAAYALGRIGDSSVVPALLQGLRSLDDDLREGCIEAIGSLHAESASGTLLTIAGDPSEPAAIRAAALRALVSLGDSRLASASAAILADVRIKSDLRNVALDAIVAVGAPDTPDLLLQGLKDPSVSVRASSASYLRNYPSPGVVDALIALLKDKASDVRVSAARALGEIRDTRAVEPLLAVAQDETCDRDTRAFALIALSDLGDRLAVGPLITELRLPPEHDGLDCLIAIALGNLGDQRAVQPLINVITSPAIKEATDVCYYAVEALGKLRDKRAVEPILRMLIYNDRYLRCYAVQALGLLGDLRALPYLQWLADYGSEWIYDLGYIRNLAKEAIERIKSRLTPDP